MVSFLSLRDGLLRKVVPVASPRNTEVAPARIVSALGGSRKSKSHVIRRSAAIGRRATVREYAKCGERPGERSRGTEAGEKEGCAPPMSGIRTTHDPNCRDWQHAAQQCACNSRANRLGCRKTISSNAGIRGSWATSRPDCLALTRDCLQLKLSYTKSALRMVESCGRAFTEVRWPAPG